MAETNIIAGPTIRTIEWTIVFLRKRIEIIYNSIEFYYVYIYIHFVVFIREKNYVRYARIYSYTVMPLS